MALDFLVRQLVPMRRTAEVLFNMSGRLISEATLSKWMLRVHHAIDLILTAPVMYVDETSIRVNRGWNCSANQHKIPTQQQTRQRWGRVDTKNSIIPHTK